jgi:glycosyltransferase EpsJ
VKFSVIIPIYNCADRLHTSVESILKQSYPDFELILVDDGSQDKSLEVCNTYASSDSRVKVIHQENAGAGPARNNGIQQATGEYLVFCDADDFYELDALDHMAKAIEQYHPDLVIGNYREFQYGANGTVVCGVAKNESASYLQGQEAVRGAYMHLRQQGLITAPWTKAYRRQLVVEKQIVFPPLRRCQDVVFNLNYYEFVQSLCVVDSILYNYQTPDGDTYLNKFPVTMFDIHKQVYRLLRDCLKRWGVFDLDAETYLNACFLKDTSILLRLNYKNNWKLSTNEQKELSERMLSDEMTRNACKTIPKGKMDQMIRFVLKSRSRMLVDFFSWGTIIYQKWSNKAWR